jgi:hypothetical protein
MGNTLSAVNGGSKEYSHQEIAKNIQNLLKNSNISESSYNLDSFTLQNTQQSSPNIDSILGGGNGNNINIKIPQRNRYAQYENKFKQMGSSKIVSKSQKEFSADFSMGTENIYENTTELGNMSISDVELKQLRDSIFHKNRKQMGGCGGNNDNSLNNNQAGGCGCGDNNLNNNQAGGCGCGDNNISATSSQPINYGTLTGGNADTETSDISLSNEKNETNEKKDNKKDKKDKKVENKSDTDELSLDDDLEDDDLEDDSDDDELEDDNDLLARPKINKKKHIKHIKHKKSLSRTHKKESMIDDSSESSNSFDESSSSLSNDDSDSSDSSFDNSPYSDYDFRHRNRLNRLRYGDYKITSQSQKSSENYIVDAKPFYSSDSGYLYGEENANRNNKLRNRIK